MVIWFRFSVGSADLKTFNLIFMKQKILRMIQLMMDWMTLCCLGFH